MLKTALGLLPVLLLSLATISCEKLDQANPVEQYMKKLGAEPSKFSDAILLEYGDLLQVNIISPSSDLALLTFQKPDKSLVLVWVSLVGGELVKGVRTIPRR